MHDIAMCRWDRNSGLIIEETLDGNIHISHNQGAMYSQWKLDVEDNTVDLTSFKRSYAVMELGPALESAGFEVVLPEPEQSESILGRIKTLITG